MGWKAVSDGWWATPTTAMQHLCFVLVSNRITLFPLIEMGFLEPKIDLETINLPRALELHREN